MKRTLLIFLLFCFLPSPLLSQGLPQAKPVYPYTHAWFVSINDNWQSPCGLDIGSNPTEAIASDFSNIATSGTVDISCYQNNLTITSDIFSTVTQSILIYLGEQIVTVNANATIGSNFMICSGPGGAIRAGFGFTLTNNAVPCFGGGSTGVGPGAPNDSFQFNNSGTFGGARNFLYNPTTGQSTNIQSGGTFANLYLRSYSQLGLMNLDTTTASATSLAAATAIAETNTPSGGAIGLIAGASVDGQNSGPGQGILVLVGANYSSGQNSSSYGDIGINVSMANWGAGTATYLQGISVAAPLNNGGGALGNWVGGYFQDSNGYASGVSGNQQDIAVEVATDYSPSQSFPHYGFYESANGNPDASPNYFEGPHQFLEIPCSDYTPLAGFDFLCANNSHQLEASLNGGPFEPIGGAGGTGLGDPGSNSVVYRYALGLTQPATGTNIAGSFNSLSSPGFLARDGTAHSIGFVSRDVTASSDPVVGPASSTTNDLFGGIILTGSGGQTETLATPTTLGAAYFAFQITNSASDNSTATLSATATSWLIYPNGNASLGASTLSIPAKSTCFVNVDASAANWDAICQPTTLSGGSGVTAVTASTPLGSTGGSTPNIYVLPALPNEGLLSANSYNGASVLQSVDCAINLPTGTQTCAFPNPIRSTSQVAVIIVKMYQGGTTLSDSQSNTFSAVSLGTNEAAVYYASSVTGGADTISVSGYITGNARSDIILLELNGTSSYDTGNTNNTGGSPTTVSITTGGANELLVGFLESCNYAGCTGPSVPGVTQLNYTTIFTDSNPTGLIATAQSFGVGSYSFTGTNSNPYGPIAVLAAFVASGSGALTPFTARKLTPNDLPIHIGTGGLLFPEEMAFVICGTGNSSCGSQTGSISTTTLYAVPPGQNYLFDVKGALSCDTSVSTATVNMTIGYTDPSGTAQSLTLGSAAACSTLGPLSTGTMDIPFNVEGGTLVTYATTDTNSGHYSIRLALYQLSQN